MTNNSMKKSENHRKNKKPTIKAGINKSQQHIQEKIIIALAENYYPDIKKAHWHLREMDLQETN